MKPLIVLLGGFVTNLIVVKIITGNSNFAFSGRMAMSLMLVFTAIGHFAFTKGMTMMIPSFIPFKSNVVYLTGILEIVIAIGLLIPNFRIISAWILIIFLILMLPANIHAAMHQIDYQKGTFDGHGLNYLWFRIPLQLIFIIWTYFSAIRIL